MSTIATMVGRISHRGPDASDVWVNGCIGLGHARLAIIDREGSAQPMRDGDVCITFNGEIFNYLELREALAKDGYRFRTRGDTEVVLAAYRVYGDDCVQAFNGQWSFAIWDGGKRRLFASRDRYGVRPFFYTRTGGDFVFASEVKALFAYPGVRRQIDPIGLDQVFTFWSAVAPRTVFAGIQQLEPGWSLSVDAEDGTRRTWPHWRPSYDIDPELDVPGNDAEAATRITQALEQATALRLRADVPVAAYVSGGIDSAMVTALARRHGGALTTYSIGFDDPALDESAHQRRVARHLGLTNIQLRVKHSDIALALPAVVRHCETPLLRTAPVPLYLLAAKVREHGTKVVLTGEGADEVFGGYDIFKEAKVRRFWGRNPEAAWRALPLRRLYLYLQELQRQPNAYRRAFFQVTPSALADPLFSHLPRWGLTKRLKSFYSRALIDQLQGHDVLAELRDSLPAAFARWTPFAQAQYLESTTLLPGYILASQSDRVMLAHGVEGRYPFLDVNVARLGAGLPPRLKMHGLREKHALKLAARDLVPTSIVAREKQPYRAPDVASFVDIDRRALRDQFVRAALSVERIDAAGLFDARAVQGLIAKIASNGAVGAKENMAFVGILSTQLLVSEFLTEQISTT